jgi:hypothetical protein
MTGRESAAHLIVGTRLSTESRTRILSASPRVMQYPGLFRIDHVALRLSTTCIAPSDIACSAI